MTVSPLKLKPKRRLISVASVLAAGVFGLALLTPGTTAAQPKPGKPLYWGALIGPELTGTAPPWDMSAAAQFTASVGKGMSVLPFSAPFLDCTQKPCEYLYFPEAAMQSIRDYGAIPFFNWASQATPTSPDQKRFRLKQIINGKYDEFIEGFAEGAAAWGHPFFLRFDWEMNGFWYPWSPGVNHNKTSEFVAAWRHVWRIFQSVGATNATWVWCPNVDFTGKLTPVDKLYPGNKYVNWTCLDGFNWGKTHNSIGWQTFPEIFRSTYRRVTKLAPGKPMMIGETASDDRGGSKPAWIKEMLNVIPKRYPKVRGLIWYDEKDQGMHWPLSSSQAATNAFAKGISSSLYRPNVYGGQPAGKIGPPTTQAPPPEPPAAQP